MQEHKYSLTEIESWVPWESNVYINVGSTFEEKRRYEVE